MFYANSPWLFHLCGMKIEREELMGLQCVCVCVERVNECEGGWGLNEEFYAFMMMDEV